ncbi:hypothetical protein GGQ74_002496 [Desulfobaculum xiamenense]|uniref:Transmembrane protein n=1 Tax=Desulfobaculum xiamenense TaxID=995050 RepID=A0A846QR22_9BACT|nr:hypothetical protein [Desulfobaculum xiamenense]NJB68823.1 hypothetical protein [Desulfobaculum xiamenense]
MLREYTELLLVLVMRALEVSTDLMTPIAILIYIATMALIYFIYFTRSHKFGSLIHIIGGVFLFFVIWNHPDYIYYKRNPWNGGYLYAVIMIVAYVYVPMKIATLATEFWRHYFKPLDRL